MRIVGLDLYCRERAMQAVVDYLDRVDCDAANRARRRYALAEDGRSLDATAPGGCEDRADEVVQHLIEHWEQTVARVLDCERRDGLPPELLAEVRAHAADAFFALAQGDVCLRGRHDQQMAATLDALLRSRGGLGKIVVWGHAAQIGDGEVCGQGDGWRLGQLARQRHGDAVRLVGMTMYQGTVTLATRWGEPRRCIWMTREAPKSCEALFHRVGESAFFLMPRQAGAATGEYLRARPSRHPGPSFAASIARCDHEIVPLAGQFDVLIHLDETTALEPLDRTKTRARGAVAGPSPRAAVG